MILEKIKEQCVRSIQAAISSSDSRFESEAIEDLIRLARLEMLIISVNGSRAMAANPFIAGQWALTYVSNINIAEQDDEADYLVLSKPRTVRINQHLDGILFLGKEKSPVSFTQLKGWEQASMALDLGEIYANGGEHFIDEGDRVVVFGNKSLKKLKIRGVFERPEDVPSFDIYNDHYPIPDDLVPQLVLMVRDRFMAQQQAQVPDLTQSGNDLTPPKISR
jgi:hypothetical protein